LVYSSARLHTANAVPTADLLEKNIAMSMNPEPICPILEETAHVARAAFPKGNLYIGSLLARGPGEDRGRYVAIAILRAVSLGPSPTLRDTDEVYFSGTQTP